MCLLFLVIALGGFVFLLMRVSLVLGAAILAIDAPAFWRASMHIKWSPAMPMDQVLRHRI